MSLLLHAIVTSTVYFGWRFKTNINYNIMIDDPTRLYFRVKNFKYKESKNMRARYAFKHLHSARTGTSATLLLTHKLPGKRAEGSPLTLPPPHHLVAAGSLVIPQGEP